MAEAVEHVEVVAAAGEHRSAPRGSAGSPGNLQGTAALLQLPGAALRGMLMLLLWALAASGRASSILAAPQQHQWGSPSARGYSHKPPESCKQTRVAWKALAGGSSWEGAPWAMQIPV